MQPGTPPGAACAQPARSSSSPCKRKSCSRHPRQRQPVASPSPRGGAAIPCTSNLPPARSSSPPRIAHNASPRFPQCRPSRSPPSELTKARNPISKSASPGARNPRIFRAAMHFPSRVQRPPGSLRPHCRAVASSTSARTSRRSANAWPWQQISRALVGGRDRLWREAF